MQSGLVQVLKKGRVTEYHTPFFKLVKTLIGENICNRKICGRSEANTCQTSPAGRRNVKNALSPNGKVG